MIMTTIGNVFSALTLLYGLIWNFQDWKGSFELMFGEILIYSGISGLVLFTSIQVFLHQREQKFYKKFSEDHLKRK